MLDVIAPTRSAEDILSRVVRVKLGGQTYELSVRSIRANREWKANLDARFASLVAGLDAADDRVALFELLSHQVDDLIELLTAYDTAGVLPSRDDIEGIEPDVSVELVAAVREVWRAANPLVATGIDRLTPTAPSSPPTSSQPVSITGPRKKSRTA